MTSDFFRANRAHLLAGIGDSLVIGTAYTALQQRGDTAYRFSQEANFWYLTGIDEADWRLVIDGKAGKSWLIAPATDEIHQLFSGGLNADEAQQTSGVDVVLNHVEGEQLLADLSMRHSEVYTLGGTRNAERFGFTRNPAQEHLERHLKKLFRSVRSCHEALARLRAIKQPVEIEAMQQAAQLSVEAFQKVKSQLTAFDYEYEVEAELTYTFRRRNARHAFEPIVASGKNACTLHYEANSSRLQPGTLLLIDAGARVGEYPTDITRTYALGEPSERQSAVHATLQQALHQIIEHIQPGGALQDYIAVVDTIMKEALLSLGLMKSKDDIAAYHRFFPHAISHGIGIDVHESLGGYKHFEPGMVLTVEPGIYILEESIGVRIEDTILVTPDGHKNLTASLSTDY